MLSQNFQKILFISIIGLALFACLDFACAANTAPVLGEIVFRDSDTGEEIENLTKGQDFNIEVFVGDIDGNANLDGVFVTVVLSDDFFQNKMLCMGDGYSIECWYPHTPDENWGNQARISIKAYDKSGAWGGTGATINIQTPNAPIVEITSGNLIRNKNQDITARITDTDGDLNKNDVWVHVKSATSDWEIKTAQMSCLSCSSDDSLLDCLDCFYQVNIDDIDCDSPENAVIFIFARDHERNDNNWAPSRNINIINQLSEMYCLNGIDDDCDTFMDDMDDDCAVSGVCNMHHISGWAWSHNIGWISLSCRNSGSDGEDYGVDIEADGNLYGHAWSEYIGGWIDFSPDSFPDLPNHSAQVDLETGEVSGWAKVVSSNEYIKFSGNAADGSPYGVTVDSENKFNGWAWGYGNESDEIEGTGWISFSSRNCDADGDGYSDGNGTGGQGGHIGCPSEEKEIEPYQVISEIDIITEPENQKPNKPSHPSSHRDGEEIEYCAFSKDNAPAQGIEVKLYWTYSDPEDDAHIASEIWIDDNQGFSGSNPEFYTILSGDSTMFDLNLLQNRNLGGFSQLQWDTKYYWKVKVIDSFGNESDWSDINSFTMPVHRFPIPDFTRDIINPKPRETISFTDQTDFKGSNPGLRAWHWSFGDRGFSSLQNPFYSYRFSGRIYTISLKSCDEVGCCSCSKKIRVGSGSGSGGWVEIPPIE